MMSPGPWMRLRGGACARKGSNVLATPHIAAASARSPSLHLSQKRAPPPSEPCQNYYQAGPPKTLQWESTAWLSICNYLHRRFLLLPGQIPLSNEDFVFALCNISEIKKFIMI